MPATDLPLQDLAHRLAQKQTELEDARRAYAARLADLTRRKEELQAQLGAVDAEIQAVSAPVPVPAAAASTPAPAASATRPQPTVPQAEGAPSLPRLLLDLVRAAGRPITAKELADEVVRAKFKTTSSNVPKLVKNKVSELIGKGLLRRAKGQSGVVLTPQDADNSAPAAKAVPHAKATGRNGAAAPPARAAAKRGTESLRDLLTRLLTQATRPLKARELAEQALAAGYQTESRDFVNVVWVALGKMDTLENVQGQGYRMKKRSAKAK